MLGIMKTDHDVGIYSVVLKVAGLTSFVLMSINTFAAPKFSELYHEGKKEDLIFVAQQFSKILLITSLLIGSIFILFGNYILLYFGTEFTKGYYPLILIVISWIFHAWAGPIAVMMNMIGLHKQLQYIVFLAAATNVILNLLLIPKYGITGSATATMISGLIIDILTIIVIWKKEGFFILYLPKISR
jgi:O-antigen/teichoic acid export membrane protein